MHTPDLYKSKFSLKQIEDPLEKLDYVIVNAMEASNELGQIEAQQYWENKSLKKSMRRFISINVNF